MSDDRLARVFAADRPPGRDNAFTLEVLARAEAERWRRDLRLAIARGAWMAGAAAAAAVGLGGWVSAYPDTAVTGILAAAGLLTPLAGARLFRGRLQPN